MLAEAKQDLLFPGFPDMRANVTFVPIQFFTIILPHCSRGTVRIVGYALRRLLGWVDECGNPIREQLRVTYRELIEKAGVSRESIGEALREAVQRCCLRCVQSPNPDRNGQPAHSGVYEIRWQEGPYSDNPNEFKGFYYPEAAMVEVPVGKRTVTRPKAARKNIPNLFFDFLLSRERLSVIRVVGALLFYSIQWGPGGERKVPVCKSITELGRLTHMSRQHVHSAVNEALKTGYITLGAPGHFDPAAGRGSRAATYGIHWALSVPSEERITLQCEPLRVGKAERERDRLEKVNGAPVRKGERDRSEIVNGERSKMVNGISIKKELKNSKTTAAGTEAAAVGCAFDLLQRVGFDEKTAKRLAAAHSWNVIQRQIEWLPHRNVRRSRLGLLRRAIEEDWPRPEAAGKGGAESPANALGRVFASNYYAAYHDFEGAAETEPFPKDLEMATKFVSRILRQEGDEALTPTWGRQFGRLMREKHQGDAKAKPTLSVALVLFGDSFLRLLQREATARARKAIGKAKEAHQHAFTAAYVTYLKTAEAELQRGNPSIYEAFIKHRERLRHLMASGPFLVSGDRLARFESEERRLFDLAEFCKDRAGQAVLGFWEWDARLNEYGFGKRGAETTASEEARV